jgi:predicted nucleotidyltransferase component of viral defense system
MTLAARMVALSPDRRALVFEQAAAGQAGQAVMLEKDFWVSWLLGLLFADPELGPHLVFKGGTSLSKVFGVIDRFSEDIDLCLVPRFVGADADEFDTCPVEASATPLFWKCSACAQSRRSKS